MRIAGWLLALLVLVPPAEGHAQRAQVWRAVAIPHLSDRASGPGCCPIPQYRLSIQGTGRPKAGAGRVIGELAVGTLASWLGAILGYAIGRVMPNDYRVKGDEGYSPAGNVGFALGSGLGAATSVWGLSHDGRHAGSFPAALAGVGLPTLVLLAGSGDPYLPLFGTIFGTPIQSLGATLAVNLTLR